ncbi:hypothetical protein OHR68_13570 [Spirillospora sp. NBC_00431]
MTQMAGGFGLLRADTLPGRIKQSFLARIEELPGQIPMLLLAAAEPTALVWRAGGRLGVTQAEALADGTQEWLSLGARVTFRHPLVRSAVYRSASKKNRRAVHLALADVTDPEADPDRRAWHLASAATAPDESAAAELERSPTGRGRAAGSPPRRRRSGSGPWRRPSTRRDAASVRWRPGRPLRHRRHGVLARPRDADRAQPRRDCRHLSTVGRCRPADHERRPRWHSPPSPGAPMSPGTTPGRYSPTPASSSACSASTSLRQVR